jgi:hypothetical protein
MVEINGGVLKVVWGMVFREQISQNCVGSTEFFRQDFAK